MDDDRDDLSYLTPKQLLIVIRGTCHELAKAIRLSENAMRMIPTMPPIDVETHRVQLHQLRKAARSLEVLLAMRRDAAMN